MLFKVDMLSQLFAVLALLLMLFAGTAATVTGALPECDGLGKSWSQIGNNDTIAAGATELCGIMEEPNVCHLGCFEKAGCINIDNKYSVYMSYQFDQKVHNITMPCMEHFNATKEACSRGGRIDFMVRDDTVLNGTRFHGNFTT